MATTPLGNIEIRCLRCGQWFAAPIDFGSMEAFEANHLYGNQVTCRHCGQFTPCNKENTRLVAADGSTGFIGADTTELATANRHEGETFTSVTVTLDDTAFIGCTFDRCHVVFGASGPVLLDSNHFRDCTFQMTGAALMTLSLLRSWHAHGGFFKQLVMNSIAGPAQNGRGHEEG